MSLNSPSSITLSIDELRWLQASAAMDSRDKFNLDSASIPDVLHDSDPPNNVYLTPPTLIPSPSPTATSVPRLEWTSLTETSTNSSPPSSFKKPAPVSKLTLATHIHPVRVQSRAPNTNRYFHLVDSPSASSIQLPYSPSSPTSVKRLPPSPSTPTTAPASPSRIPRLSQTSRSPSTPLSRSLPTKHPEWIYRHPKPRIPSASSPSSPSPRPRTRSTSSRNRPRPQTGYHTPGSPQARSHSYSHSPPKPSIAVPAATPLTPPSSPKGSPFWATLLRPRPRTRRSIPSLKAAYTSPTRIPIPISTIPISAPIPPLLPPKSPSRPPSHQRNPSASSTASSTSTNTATISTSTATNVTTDTPASRSRSHSTSSSSSSSSNSNSSSSYTTTSATSSVQPETPTTPPSLYSSSSPCSETLPERPPYPIPSKSILSRASSVSTKNSTSTSISTSCSAAKSVTFVDVPTVHYHEGVGCWDAIEEEDTKYTSENSISTPDIHEIGVDLDSMDMDMDSAESYVSSSLDDEEEPEGSTEMYLRGVQMRELCSTPTPASVRGRGKLEKEREMLKSKGKIEGQGGVQGQGQGQQTRGLKRLMSLTRKSPVTPSRFTPSPTGVGRPTISGPFALGSHPQTQTQLQSPPLSPAHPPSPSSTLLSPYATHSLSTTSLRSSGSIRSVHSYRSQTRSTYTRNGKPRQSPANTSDPKSKTGGFSSLPTFSASASLRHVPSLESFRSAAGRSVRSLGSVKSSASTKGFRAWLSKLGSGIGIGPITWEG